MSGDGHDPGLPLNRRLGAAGLRLAAPMVRRAIERRLSQIEGRQDVPQAWNRLVVCRLLVGEPYGALDALAHLFDLCSRLDNGIAGGGCAAGQAATRLARTLSRLSGVRDRLPGYDWVERAVLLGLAVRVGDAVALDAVRARASWGRGEAVYKPGERIVILSGGCSPEVESLMPPLQQALTAAVAGETLTLISGGTAMGISGVAGAIAGQSAGRIRAIGYLPNPICEELTAAGRAGHYARLVPSAGRDFSPLDPLQGWTDLIAAGIDPARVTLLAYAGKAISRVECALALALGARVGVVAHANIPRERVFDDPAWTRHPNFRTLRLDAGEIRAWILADGLWASSGDLPLARCAAPMDMDADVEMSRE